MQSSFEIGQDPNRALDESLHAAIVESAHPAAEASGDGLALDERAEADTLDLAADEIAAAFGHDGYTSVGAGATAVFFTSR